MAVYINDTFTDTNGTAMGSHTPDTDAEAGGWTVGNYTDDADTTGTCDIQSNAFNVSTSFLGARIDTGQTDYQLTVDWTTGAGDNRCIIMVRRVDDNNYLYYNLREANGDIRLQKATTAGGEVTADSTSFSFSDSTTYAIKIQCEGNDYKIWIDDTQITAIDHTTSDNNTGQLVGLYAASISVAQTFDNLVVQSIAAATGRIMSSLVGPGGLAAKGGIAGKGGGLAG